MTDEPCTPEQIEAIIAEARRHVEALAICSALVDELEQKLSLPRDRWYELWELL